MRGVINTLFKDSIGDMLGGLDKLAALGMNAMKDNGNEMVGRSAPIVQDPALLTNAPVRRKAPAFANPL